MMAQYNAGPNYAYPAGVAYAPQMSSLPSQRADTRQVRPAAGGRRAIRRSNPLTISRLILGHDYVRPPPPPSHSRSFIIGWFCTPVWLGGFCVNGGVCSPNRSAKIFNILSVVMFFLTVIAIGIAVAVVVTQTLRAVAAIASIPTMNCFSTPNGVICS
jgi:hypothetical protein